MTADITTELGCAVRECGTPPCFMSFELGPDECVCACRIEAEPAANPAGGRRRRASARSMKVPRKRKGQSWQQYHDHLSGLAAKALKEGKEAESFGYQVAAKMVARRHHDDVMATRKPGYRPAGPGTLSWNDCMEGLRKQHPTWSDDRCRKVCGSIRAKSKRMYPAYWGVAKRNPDASAAGIDHESRAEEALTTGLRHFSNGMKRDGWSWPVAIPQEYLPRTKPSSRKSSGSPTDYGDLAEAIVVLSASIGHCRQSSHSAKLERIVPIAIAVRDEAEMQLRAARASIARLVHVQENPWPSPREWAPFRKAAERIARFVDGHFHGRPPSVEEGLSNVESYIVYLRLVGELESSDPLATDEDTYSFNFRGYGSDENYFWKTAKVGLEENPRTRRTAKRNPSKGEHEKLGDQALAEGMMNLYVSLDFGGYSKADVASEMPDWMVRQVQVEIEDGQSQVAQQDDPKSARLRLAIIKGVIAIVQLSAAENNLKMVSPKKPSKEQQKASKCLKRACSLLRDLAARTSTTGHGGASVNPSAKQHEQNYERISWFIGDLVDRAFGGQMPGPLEGIEKVDSYIAYLCLAGALVANDAEALEDDTFIPSFVLRPPEGNVFRRSMATPSKYLHTGVPAKKKDPKQWNPAARGGHAAGGGNNPRAAGTPCCYRCTIIDKAGNQKGTWEGDLKACQRRCPGLVVGTLAVSQMTCRNLRDGGMLYLQRIA